MSAATAARTSGLRKAAISSALTVTVVDAIERTIERLAEDPFNRRLGTTAFRSEALGKISATPVRAGNWYLIWRRGNTARSIALVLITRLDVGKSG